jgi:hypothetical protein
MILLLYSLNRRLGGPINILDVSGMEESLSSFHEFQAACNLITTAIA